jgi:hypothetical protein
MCQAPASPTTDRLFGLSVDEKHRRRESFRGVWLPSLKKSLTYQISPEEYNLIPRKAELEVTQTALR